MTIELGSRIHKNIVPLMWMINGAWLVALWVRFIYPGLIPPLELFSKLGFFVLLALKLLGPEKRNQDQLTPPSPPQLVWLFCLVAGLFAAIFFLLDYHTTVDLILPAAIILVSAATAVFLGRFARNHAGDVG